MINLTNTANILKKIVNPLAIVLLITFLVAIIIFQFFTNSNKPENLPLVKIEGPVFTKLTTTTVRFNTQNLDFPQQTPEALKVYYSSQTVNFLTNANSIATKLGLSQQPIKANDVVVGTKFNYSNVNTHLAIYENGIYYSNFSLNLPQTGQFKKPEELKNIALDFLANLGIKSTYSKNFQTSYYQTSYEKIEPTNNLEEANRLTIDLNYEISGIKVLGQNIQVNSSFNKNNQLLEILYNNFSPGEEIGIYPLITAQDALQILLSKNGALIDIRGLDIRGPYPEHFNSVDLKKGYLAYYQPDNEGQTIQPVWVFEGEAEINKQPVYLTFATP